MAGLFEGLQRIPNAAVLRLPADSAGERGARPWLVVQDLEQFVGQPVQKLPGTYNHPTISVAGGGVGRALEGEQQRARLVGLVGLVDPDLAAGRLADHQRHVARQRLVAVVGEPAFHDRVVKLARARITRARRSRGSWSPAGRIAPAAARAPALQGPA
jgi:hypothetical protein